MRRIPLSDSLFFNLGDRYIVSVCRLSAPCDFVRFRGEMKAAVTHSPALAERIRRRPFGFVGVPDDNFRIADHVQPVAAPQIRSIGDLIAFSNRVLHTPLPRARPPWRALVINPLGTDGCDESSMRAVIFQMMHGLTDGIRALQLFASMGNGLAPQPDGSDHSDSRSAPASVPPWTPEARDAAQGQGIGVIEIHRKTLARAARGGDRGVTEALVAICRTVLARPDLLHLSRPLSGRIAHTRMLMRRPGETGKFLDLGNHLKTDVSDIAMPGGTRLPWLPRIERAQGSSWSQHLVARSPPPLARWLMRLWVSKFDAFVSLVPGPVRPVTLGGASVRAVYGIAPPSGPVPIALICVTYARRATLTVLPGPGTTADPQAIADALREALEALAAAGERMAEPSR